MGIINNKSGADTFFTSMLTASAATVLLWGEFWFSYPDFVRGLAAGLIAASAFMMYRNRTYDEYTLATWHTGTSASFAMLLVWLVTGSLGLAFHDLISTTQRELLDNAGLVGLTAISVFLMTIAWKRWGKST